MPPSYRGHCGPARCLVNCLSRQPCPNGSPPSVNTCSCGNVGQLAVDLFIATLELRPLGSLHHASLLPAAGAAAFAHAPGILSSGLELFADPARKLACLQQRAPADPGRQVELAQATAAWIVRSGFKQVRRSCHASTGIFRGWWLKVLLCCTWPGPCTLCSVWLPFPWWLYEKLRLGCDG